MPEGQLGPMSNGRMEMRVQRHDAHEAGHLTAEGQEHAKEIATQTVNEYLNRDPNTHFMIINSDQPWDESEPNTGRRAQETGVIVGDAIKEELKKRELPEEQLFGYSNQDPSTVSPVIREADIFDNQFMAHLRQKYPDENEWSMYYQDADAQERKERHAEDPMALAQRMDYMIKTAEMSGASFHKTPGNEDKPLLVWMIGHGGGLDAYLYRYAGVPLDELGFPLSGGFTIRAASNGEVVADVKGKEYPIRSDETMNLPQ